MNCRRSGSSYGSLQSISDSRYGETRTVIGARSKPRCASAMNAVGHQALERRQQLADVGDRVLGLPVVVEELRLADVRVGGDAAPELAAQQLAVREAWPAAPAASAPRGGAASGTVASLLSDDMLPLQRTT